MINQIFKVGTNRYHQSFVTVQVPSPLTVTVTVSEFVTLGKPVSEAPYLSPEISPDDTHPLVCCLITIPALTACAGSESVAAVKTTDVAVLLDSDRSAVEHSAYALLIFAKSVPSRLFSNCAVNIGILIATSTAVIFNMLILKMMIRV